MTALAGINVAGRAEYAPSVLRQAGVRIARCPLYIDTNISPWLDRCDDCSISTIVICGSEMLTDFEDQWPARFDLVAERYLPSVPGEMRRGPTYFQIGNEPDADPRSVSSWIMSQSRLNRLLRLAQQKLATRGARLLGPGLCSGQPSWANGVEWERTVGIAAHPYGKHPGAWWRGADWGTGDGIALINAYAELARAYRRELFVTEFGWQTTGDGALSEELQGEYYGVMLTAYRTLQSEDGSDILSAVIPFCWEDEMVTGFGLKDHGRLKPSYHAFAAAAGASTVVPLSNPPDPTEQPARFEQGFAKLAALRPDLTGRPLAPEWGAWSGVYDESGIHTTTGWLFWTKDADPPDFGHHSIYLDNGQRWRWRESWPLPMEVHR